MKKMVLVAALLAIFVPRQVIAAGWELYYVDKQGKVPFCEFYLDKDSVMSPEKGIIRAWQKKTCFDAQKAKSEETVDLTEIDCKERTERTLLRNKEDKDGAYMGRNPFEWHYADPEDTVFSARFKTLCKATKVK